MTHIASPPHVERDPMARPHAIVIGAGFGGLAAAIRLGARGYRVTVIDRLQQAGGRASVFRQDGFTFDAGPTIITAPFLFEELWELCGRQLSDDIDLKPLDPFYRIRFQDGSIFACSSDPEKMRAEIAKFNPDDVAGYEHYLKESEAAFDIGFGKLVDLPFSTFGSMLAIVPHLIRLRADRSVLGHVSLRVKDHRLRQALSFHPLFIGGNPVRVTAILSLIAFLERKWGVHFAMGGTGALVDGMVRLIESQNGTLRLNTEAREIMVDGRRARGVRLADGSQIEADIVVSNGDPAFIYKNLLPKIKRRRWTDFRLRLSRYSMSLFVWYFGTKRQYHDVDHHMVLMGPRYEGLLKDIFDRKKLASDFSLYLHRPTASDPSLAPEGCDAFYVLSPVPHLDADIDWEKEAERYRSSIEAELERTVLPGLKDNIVTSKIMTPLDFRDRLLSEKGAAFGLEPLLVQSAYFRPHNRSEEVENLYLVGAGTHPGAGLPGVLSSARVLDKVVPHGSVIHVQ